MAEWPIAVVLKTIEPKGSGGSNPPLSASFISIYILYSYKYLVLLKKTIPTTYRQQTRRYTRITQTLF